LVTRDGVACESGNLLGKSKVMSFVIQAGQLPASITAGPMTDEEFAAFCVEHPDLDF